VIRTIHAANFFGGPRPDPTPDQRRLCAYTPFRDVACLLRLCELHQPKRFLEIGCHRGATMLLLSEAMPNCRIVGCDPGDHVLPFEQNAVQRGEYLRQEQIGELVKHRGVAIYRVPFSELPNIGKFDAVFIDGDHRANAVKHDISKALALLEPAGFIALHDCGNPVTPDVESVLRESPVDFIRVEDSWIAYHISAR
jgi:predicted O-methyltransferase YrrM